MAPLSDFDHLLVTFSPQLRRSIKLAIGMVLLAALVTSFVGGATAVLLLK